MSVSFIEKKTSNPQLEIQINFIYLPRCILYIQIQESIVFQEKPMNNEWKIGPMNFRYSRVICAASFVYTKR